MGLLAKISPQMNLLMIGFPIKILLGLIILMFLQGLLMEVTKDIFYYSFDFINQFINVARQHA
jgi:flagellar biosynthetic protein FliR